jgi:PAS domain S-box-containing protein
VAAVCAVSLDQDLASAIVEAMPDAVLLIDQAETIVFANARVEAMLGYGRDELVGRSIEVLVPRGVGDARRPDLSVRRKDGSELSVEMSVSPLRTACGAFSAVAIRVSSFRALFDETPEGVFVSNRENRWTDVNPAACRMLGYSREELLGKWADDFFPPEDVSKLVEAREELGHTTPARSVTLEHGMRRKDGTFVPVEVTAKFFEDGHCRAFMRDISDRRRAERERDESLCWTRAVLEQSPVGLALTRGPQLEPLEFNARAEELLGQPLDGSGELNGRLHGLDGQPTDSERLPIIEAMRSKQVVAAQFLAKNAASGFTPIAVKAAPIVGPDGRMLGAVAAFEDITAVKELERLRAEWSGVVAHDLRQPLGAISLTAELLARATESPTFHRYAERIHAASTRLNRMVGDLMDISRIEASRLELVRQPVDVTAVLRSCVEHAALQAPDRAFDVRVQGEVPDTDADPDRIAQVIENLLTNAIKYGKAGSGIVATVAHECGEVAVSVANEGRPLSSEELARIFERFQRTPSAKLEGIQGVGLGLYITRSLVEAHGGRITAESSPEGINTFRFTVPAHRR